MSPEKFRDAYTEVVTAGGVGTEVDAIVDEIQRLRACAEARPSTEKEPRRAGAVVLGISEDELAGPIGRTAGFAHSSEAVDGDVFCASCGSQLRSGDPELSPPRAEALAALRLLATELREEAGPPVEDTAENFPGGHDMTERRFLLQWFADRLDVLAAEPSMKGDRP